MVCPATVSLHPVLAGKLSVTPDYEFRASGRLKEDYDNGRSYMPFDKGRIHVPVRATDRPDRRLLEWHGAERFLG
jgi:putative restriction endonuclease